MKKFLLTALLILAIPPLIALSLWILDTKSNFLPQAISTYIRETIGYCIDGRQVYWQNRPFITSVNGACRVCTCAPTLGGVSCQYTGENISCNQ